MLYDEHLLLRMVEDNHLKNCLIIKDEVQNIHMFIQKFFPDFQKSKVLYSHSLCYYSKRLKTALSYLNGNFSIGFAGLLSSLW